MTDPMSSPPKATWYRNATGNVVHRADCAHKGAKALPWNYAEGMATERLLDTAWHYGLRFCRHCSPTEDAAL